MRDIFEKNNLKISEQSLDKLQGFCDFLLEQNKLFNITAIRTPQEVYEKHFLDSLMGINYFCEGERILEVGSGGGFPSVPLKCANENLNFTLLEATGKKCEFLSQVKQKFNFENLEVINGRAEELAHDKNHRESYDKVTARAVASLNVLCELCLPFLKVGGKAIFYKLNSPSEILAGRSSLKQLGAKIEKIIPYKLSEYDRERCLIIITKESSCNEKYPRQYSKIIKKPL